MRALWSISSGTGVPSSAYSGQLRRAVRRVSNDTLLRLLKRVAGAPVADGVQLRAQLARHHRQRVAIRAREHAAAQLADGGATLGGGAALVRPQPRRVHAPARAVPRLHHHHAVAKCLQRAGKQPGVRKVRSHNDTCLYPVSAGAPCLQLARGGEPRQPGADDDDSAAAGDGSTGRRVRDHPEIDKSMPAQPHAATQVRLSATRPAQRH
jgi:hypothetical protein